MAEQYENLTAAEAYDIWDLDVAPDFTHNGLLVVDIQFVQGTNSYVLEYFNHTSEVVMYDELLTVTHANKDQK